MKLTGENRSIRIKTCPSATLSTRNPIRTDPGSNSCLRSERPATNCLSHDTAYPNFFFRSDRKDILYTEIYCANILVILLTPAVFGFWPKYDVRSVSLKTKLSHPSAHKIVSMLLPQFVT
jgi:hypothetical protein